MSQSQPTPPERRQRRYDVMAVLAAISRYQQQNAGDSPSERRIQVDLGISAPSVVHNILHRLQRQGLLVIASYGRGQSGNLTLTEAGLAAVQQWQREQGHDSGTAA